MGFEPTVGFPTLDFESSALNRTQPPFLESEKKTSNAQRRTSNFECNCLRHWAFSVGRWAFIRLKSLLFSAAATVFEGDAPLPKKCYNFCLATPNPGAAYCMTAGELRYYLLSVTDWNSQVVSVAVRKN